MSDLSGPPGHLVAPDCDAAAHEALLQFLYAAPIGFLQFTPDGTVELMNAAAGNLLMPLAPAADLGNLFDVLVAAVPGLRRLVGDFRGEVGAICDPILIDMAPASVSPARGKVLSLTLVKIDALRLMAVLRDATDDLKREQRKLTVASRLDKLTDMPNRAAVRDYLDAGRQLPAAHLRQSAVIFINFDRFKQINDSLGFAVGDEVLTLLANRLRSALRRNARASSPSARESLAARLGGDEFVVVLDDLEHGDDVHIVARRILAVLEQPFDIRDRHLQCTVSMGVVQHGQFVGDADSVLQDASIAMVEAKRAGGSRYAIFQPEMRVRAARRRDMEQDLRTALTQDQLFVVYQPVVGFRCGDVECETVDLAVGVEALVRWRHPVRGVVPPLDFIGIAEECGLIGAVGHRVLELACRQFVAWRSELGTRAPRTLSVNLSRGQLAQPGFVASVAEVLRTSGMRPEELQLEITESLAAQDETVQARLHELKAIGLTLALDDFGTGYSSLSSLHLLPVDTVKIDRSFVSESVTSSHHRVLIEATVRVARSLSMNTVAEGMETAEQVAVIRALGCDKGQGYFFSRPLSADQLAAWAQARPDQETP